MIQVAVYAQMINLKLIENVISQIINKDLVTTILVLSDMEKVNLCVVLSEIFEGTSSRGGNKTESHSNILLFIVNSGLHDYRHTYAIPLHKQKQLPVKKYGT